MGDPTGGYAVWCWEEGPRRDVGEPWGSIGTGSTCVLPEDHDGPHEFTWDDEILVMFPGEADRG